MAEPDTGDVNVSLVWAGVDELPVHASNQALVQLNPGADGRPESIVLTLGFVAPPVVLGTPAEQHLAMKALGGIAVRPLVRTAMSISRAKELVEVLGRSIKAAEESQ